MARTTIVKHMAPKVHRLATQCDGVDAAPVERYRKVIGTIWLCIGVHFGCAIGLTITINSCLDGHPVLVFSVMRESVCCKVFEVFLAFLFIRANTKEMQFTKRQCSVTWVLTL